MSFDSFSLLSVVCACLTLVGCESQRYKPADWRAASNSTLSDRGGAAVVKKGDDPRNLKRPESPTNWMELSGTGGEAVPQRRSYGTMPTRGGATSLPRRGGTSMPWRGGTSLPRRGDNDGTSLPNRQYRYSTGAVGTTTPRRGRHRSDSTLPTRKSGGTLPRR